MKKSIVSGNFTENGNFTGYNPTVVAPDGTNRIHVPAKVMETLGWTKDSDVKFPFFCIAGEREFDTVDGDRQPTGGKFKRLQANAVYKTATDLGTALSYDAVLEGEISNVIKAAATTAGLSEKQLESILSASV